MNEVAVFFYLPCNVAVVVFLMKISYFQAAHSSPPADL
jgi:hypothetical protein